MNSVSRFTQFGLVAIALLALAGRAGAVSLCASTAAELHDDLVAASTNGTYAGQDVEIDLVQGTYKTGAVTGNGPFAYSSTAPAGQIILSGGWSAGCSTYLRDARVTILDGKNLTQVLNIQNKNALVYVNFLTIQNGESTVAGGGVAINTNVTGGSVYLVDNIIRNNHTASIGGGFAIDGAGNQVSASGNLVYANSADGGFGAGFEYSRGGSEAFVESNTMTQNTTTASGGTGGLYCCGTADTALVYANIFWQNTNFGIDMETSDYSFEYNDYGTVTGTLNPDSTNLSKDPKFVDAANDNYHLAGNSPLLGVYLAQGLPSSDLVGTPYPYPVNGYFDIGAYEDTVFTDRGFESN
jgi:hypothetical protein